jgi:hypothetical protein
VDCFACYLLHADFLLGLFLNLKMEVISFFEKQLAFNDYRPYTSQDRILHVYSSLEYNFPFLFYKIMHSKFCKDNGFLTNFISSQPHSVLLAVQEESLSVLNYAYECILVVLPCARGIA